MLYGEKDGQQRTGLNLANRGVNFLLTKYTLRKIGKELISYATWTVFRVVLHHVTRVDPETLVVVESIRGL